MLPSLARIFGAGAVTLLFGCSSPLPPPPLEPVDERAASESVVVEGDLPGPKKVAPPNDADARPGQTTASQSGFKLPPNLSATSIDGHGDELFVVRGHFSRPAGQMSRINRKGEELAHVGPSNAVIRVVGRDGSPVAVATGDHGGFAYHASGRWTYRLAPALEGERTASVVRTSDGRFLVAGREHALYELVGDDWKTYRYPSSGNAIEVAAIARDGTVFLFGQHGRVMTFKNGAFVDEKIADLGTGPFVSNWIDEKRGEVWLASAKQLFKVSLAAKMALVVPSPTFFDVHAIAGADTAKGPLIAVATFGRVVLFDGKDWSLVSDEGGNDALYLDLARNQLYVAHSSSLVVHDIKHPFLGTGPATPYTR